MIFDWVDFYQELADKLLQFKNDRKPLVQILKTINESMGFYDIFIWNGIKFEDVCPFTTFALFNRGMKKENRIKICSMLKEKLGINANLPTDFLGIPIVNSQKVRFYEHDKKQNIDNLWNIFEKAIDYSRNHNITTKNEICSLFDIVESQKLVKWNLTMGLFWVRPYDYINLDQNNRAFIKKHMGEEVNNVPSGIEYFELIDRVNRFISTRDDIKNFIELSHKAWQEGEEENKKSNDNIQRVWIYAPGQNASLWDEFYKDGIMALGWDELGNLKDYNSKEDIQKRLQEMSDNTSSKKNDALANWEFANVMKKGDIVYAKKGNSLIIGKGIVKSDYLFDDTANYFKSFREVDWISNDVKDHVGLLGNTIVLKTLTDITKYEEYVKKFEEMYSNSKASVKEESENYMANNYYWLNANPKIWSFSELSVGETIDYTATNENGNKRRIYKNFVEAKKGDCVICYESYPTKKIVGLGVVDRDLFIDDDGVEVLMIKKVEELLNPISYKDLTNIAELKNMEYFKNPQGSLFKLTEEEYSVLMDLIRDNNPTKFGKKVEKYTKANFLLDVIMDDPEYDKLVTLLRNKKNIILQGAPGVGKTYIAKRLAYSIMGEKDDDRIKFVQFHQSYSYEDFVEGYKPTENSFELEKGVFYNFCKMAEKDVDSVPEKPYFFIIDEINRGNISKIFGELLMLIENDKRGEKTNLAYSKSYFSVPKNVYIIGMMNTADRSLALIDYALRRRFAFYDVKPIFANKEFKKYQANLNNKMFDLLINKIEMLNEEIINDPSLDEGFVIGHSYFCNHESIDKNMMDLIINYEILPLLKEYWFDNKDKYEEWKKIFNGVLNG